MGTYEINFFEFIKSMEIQTNILTEFILSRVYASVTNNDGFSIGWLGLLIYSFTVTRNHSQLQGLTINLQPNSSSLTAEDSLHFHALSLSLSQFSDKLLIYDWTTYIVSRRNHTKHIRCPAMDICEPHRKRRFFYCWIYSALYRNGNYPIVAYVFVVAYCCRIYLATGCLPRICLRGKMFTCHMSQY
jgi:hypothetical protein